VADRHESHAAIQRDFSSWRKGILVKFNNEKCKILHLERDNPRHQGMLGCRQLESSFAEKDLGVLVDTKLDMSQ